MDLSTCTALVTGANRGLGRHFAIALVDRGAKVYATARNSSSVEVAGSIPLRVDVTDQASITEAAEAAGDVTLVINNAGSAFGGNLLTGDVDDALRDVDTNFIGALRMIRAFAPIIESNGGGAILNVLSVLSWTTWPAIGGYCASKAAAWSMTNSVRLDLAHRGIGVTALHVGSLDTEMSAGYDIPKSDPAEIARIALDGVAAGAYEILADDVTNTVMSELSGGAAALYPDLGR